MLPRNIDPVTFEVTRNALDTIVDEMALTILRTAYSGIVKDAMDFSTGFADRNGETVAMGLTIAFHVGSFPSAVRSILRKFHDRIYPGDIYIMNDPYTSGGIHLPDVYVIKPVFADEELYGFSCTVAHQTDIGGIVPGSNSTDSSEIYQEGLRIPTTKLYERGAPNETMFDLLATNVRTPDKVLGDIRSQIASATLGERQFIDLVGRYSASQVARYMQALMEYSERRVRQEISALPDGAYTFTHYIDGDNIETGDVTIAVAMEIAGDGIAVDFTGSSPQVKAGINSPFPFTESSVWGGIRQIMDPDIPNSSGSHHPIVVTAPEASVVNPVLPAPCGARGIVGYRIMEAVWGALSHAVPDRVPADGEGGNTIISIGGYDSRRKPFAFVDLFAGSRGGRPNGDGPLGTPHPGGNSANTPVEIAEVETPVRIEEYGILPDTAGPGKHRGAPSIVRDVRLLEEEAVLQVRSDKRRNLAFGLHGGKSGSPSWNIVNPTAEDEITLTPMGVGQMKRGDIIHHVMASGGGWGDPLERDPQLVREDVRNGIYTVGFVRREFGVVIDPATLDVEYSATAALRENMR